MTEKWIWWDMDGTIANLYGVPAWLDMLIAKDPTPYRIAAPMLNMNTLARKLNKLQKMGFHIGIISWLSKNSTEEYDSKVTAAKHAWLNQHLHSVKWDAIHIVPYGRNKWEVCGAGILFDDEQKNRDTWREESYEPARIMEILNTLG